VEKIDDGKLHEQSIPSSIWIICIAFFNPQSAMMINTYFINIVTVLPTFWSFSSPNTIFFLKANNFYGIIS